MTLGSFSRSTGTALLALCVCTALGCAADESTGDRSRGGSSGDGSEFGNAMPSSPGAPGSAQSFGNGSGQSTVGGAAGAASISDEPRGCASADVRAARVKPTVYFVVDGSGSMDQDLGGISRWDALRQALMDPDGVIPSLESVVEFGMVIYDGALDPLGSTGMLLDSIIPGLGAVIPSGGPQECPRLQSANAALDNFTAIDGMYPAQPLGGSTPTHMALQWAVDNLVDDNTLVLDAEKGPQYVILATDGAPNDFCEGGAGADASAQVLQAAQGVADKGAQMFVISLAGDDPNLQAHLQQVAEIGNTGSPPFTPTSKDDLVNVLTQIVGGAVGCEVALNGAIQPGQECSGIVEVNGVALPCNDENGWQLKNESTIELTGTACADFKSRVDALLRADFPCGVFAPD
jgi:hypothetical protein